MNIVKIKDITSLESDDKRYDFRNKYCYCIQMKYLVPMNPGGLYDIPVEEWTIEQKCGILKEEYVKFEKSTDVPALILDIFERSANANDANGSEERRIIAYRTLKDGDMRYVDSVRSPMNKISVDFYYIENDRSNIKRGRSNIKREITGLKRYRSYVAKFLLEEIKSRGSRDVETPRLIKAPCPKKEAMLNYYASDMTEDNTLLTLQMLQPETTVSSACESISLKNSIKPTCSCQQSAGLVTLSNLSVGSSCNLVRNYRALMKQVMFETFTDLEFWRWFIYGTPTEESGAVGKIYDYTEALIKSGLSIFDRNGAKKLDLNNPCGCVGNSETLFANYQKDLNDILYAFSLMKEGAESFEANISTITVALQKFATYYEYLQWEKMVISTDENWS